MAVKTLDLKSVHSKLTEAFSFSFVEMRKKGLNPEKLHWFKNEDKKSATKNKRSKKRVA